MQEKVQSRVEGVVSPSTIEVALGDLDGLREAVEQIRAETFGSPVPPSGGSGLPPSR